MMIIYTGLESITIQPHSYYSTPSSPLTSSRPTYPPPPLSSSSSCYASAKGYHRVTCPIWYDESHPPLDLDPISRERGIDHRVRYTYHHQHPQDCGGSNYYINSFFDASMINAFEQTVGRGLWGALTSNRVRR